MARVCVGPPLSCSGPSCGLVLGWSPGPVSPHWFEFSMLPPPDVNAPAQLVAPAGATPSEMIVFRSAWVSLPLVARLPVTSLAKADVRPACKLWLLPSANVPLVNPDTSSNAPGLMVIDGVLLTLPAPLIASVPWETVVVPV